jgi:hypothetical protein
MDNFKLLLDGLDTSGLKQYLKDHPQLWDVITVRQDHTEQHKDTESIFIRGPVQFSKEEYLHGLESVDYPLPMELVNLLAPLMHPILTLLQPYHVGKIMLVKLKAGKEVLPHIDQGTYAKSFSRFHLAVDTCLGNKLVCEQESQHFEEGQVWWFNHRKDHSAFNKSAMDRVHLIFDLDTPLFEVSGQENE